MTRSPHADLFWHEMTVDQLLAERAHYQRIADENRDAPLHAARSFVCTIDAQIAARMRNFVA